MRALWTGQLSLARAFWERALLYGTLASLLATGSALAVHFLPVPYLVASVVGVYRSASRYSGSPIWARLAEVAVVLWAMLVVVL